MDDTMELLKESALENPPLGPSAALSAAGVHSSADEEKEAAENPSNGQVSVAGLFDRGYSELRLT
jgi:hypothetical protein